MTLDPRAGTDAHDRPLPRTGITRDDDGPQASARTIDVVAQTYLGHGLRGGGRQGDPAKDGLHKSDVVDQISAGERNRLARRNQAPGLDVEAVVKRVLQGGDTRCCRIVLERHRLVSIDRLEEKADEGDDDDRDGCDRSRRRETPAEGRRLSA